jgi:hypothetical protein
MTVAAMSGHTRLTAVVFALTIVLATAPAADAQRSSKPPRDPAKIQQKLQQSASLQRQAMQTLNDLGKAETLVKSAWGELKSAQDDMVMNQSNMQFPDPLHGLNWQRSEQALAILLGCMDSLKARDKWTEPANEVVGLRNRLQQSLGLTNTLAAVTF